MAPGPEGRQTVAQRVSAGFRPLMKTSPGGATDLLPVRPQTLRRFSRTQQRPGTPEAFACPPPARNSFSRRDAKPAAPSPDPWPLSGSALPRQWGDVAGDRGNRDPRDARRMKWGSPRRSRRLCVKQLRGSCASSRLGMRIVEPRLFSRRGTEIAEVHLADLDLTVHTREHCLILRSHEMYGGVGSVKDRVSIPGNRPRPRAHCPTGRAATGRTIPPRPVDAVPKSGVEPPCPPSPGRPRV